MPHLHFLPHHSHWLQATLLVLAAMTIVTVMWRARARGSLAGFSRAAVMGAAPETSAVVQSRWRRSALSRRDAVVETGNTAFDAYRDETIVALEREEAEFNAYLAKLRGANDAKEFETFLAGRNAADVSRPSGATGNAPDSQSAN